MKLLATSSIETFIQSQKDQKIFLFEKGKEANCFMLVLAGQIIVEYGDEKFVIEKKSWSCFGLNALIKEKWVSDFDAYVSKDCKVLKILRNEYIKSFIASHQNNDLLFTPDYLKWALEKGFEFRKEEPEIKNE